MPALETGSRVDVYLFFSFDLVGSSRLKAQKFDRFHWVELFQYFHSECRRLIAGRGVENAVVWKYLGDEVLFYQRIGTAYQVEHTIRAIDRTLAALTQELAGSAKYAAAAEFISIRAMAWVAPVLSFAEAVSDKMTALVTELEKVGLLPDDQMIHDRENNILDFLGPNIDTGFQIAASARPEHITISPALAEFLRGSERPVLDAIIEAGN
jgi:hypothetical protein